MKKKQSSTSKGRFKGWPEILLMIVIILAIPLFFTIRSQAQQGVVATGTPTQQWMTTDNAVIPTETTISLPAVVRGKQPSACTFPLSKVVPPKSKSQNYTFSEPKVLLTAPKGNIYHIAEWLPDNQQVLITEELNNVVVKNDTNFQEAISLYNPETGKTKVYALRSATRGALPSWQPGLNAVVYPVMNYYNIDRKALTYKLARQVWISYGNADSAQILADGLPQLSVTFKPDGSEMRYLSDKKIFKEDKSLKKLTSASFDFSEWDYGKGKRDKNPVYYSMAWQPGTSLIFLHSDANGGGGYTFVLNADTGLICELDLGGSVYGSGAHWSPDGRYLAIWRATNPNTSDLTVLDTLTGKLTTLDSVPKGMEGKFYVYDFIWAPDNHHLLVNGSVVSDQNNQNNGVVDGLYLIDLVSGQSAHVVSEYTTTANPLDNNWAWSSDGSKLLIRCPTHEVDRVCIISVLQTNQ